MNQLTRTSEIELNGNIEIVFPLFSAIGEGKWVPDWKPKYIYPKDGSFTANQVFKTQSNNEIEKEFNWIVSYLNKTDHEVIYTVFTENRVWSIEVSCIQCGNEKTKAKITYTYTTLNSIGDALNSKAIEKMYLNKLLDWESAINFYLENGQKIKPDEVLAK